MVLFFGRANGFDGSDKLGDRGSGLGLFALAKLGLPTVFAQVMLVIRPELLLLLAEVEYLPAAFTDRGAHAVRT